MRIKSLNIKSLFFYFGFLMCLTFIVNSRCHAYVMPAEQLLDFTAKNFSKFKTVVIIQSTLQAKQANEKVFKEEIRLKSPDLFNLKALDHMAERSEFLDMTYRQLLISNSGERLERLLSVLDFNLESVAFTRIDGVIAYRIGDKEPGSPKLLIEKARFVPLFMEYSLPEDQGGETITVRFQDYREEDDDKYYPFEISYTIGDRISEKYTIQTIQNNVSFDESFLQRFPINPSQYIPPEEEVSDIEEERLINILKTFEEKYQ